MYMAFVCLFFFSSRRRHTRCALVTGVQTCALPICLLRAIRGTGGDESGDFHALVGLKKPAHRVRIRLLCPTLRGLVGGLGDIEAPVRELGRLPIRSEEHTSEFHSLMRISYAVFCLQKQHTHIPDMTCCPFPLCFD